MSAIKGETLVVSKTRTRRDGSTETTHYACGPQRETVDQAKIDAAIWEGLFRSAPENEGVIRIELERAGFTPNLAGLKALFAERLRLWEALDAAVRELDGEAVRPFVDIRGRREKWRIRLGIEGSRQAPPEPAEHDLCRYCHKPLEAHDVPEVEPTYVWKCPCLGKKSLFKRVRGI